MAQDVKVLGRSRLPGGGFTTAGAAVQTKETVWAEVKITSYTTGGESLLPAHLGLATIDFIQFEPVSVNDAATVPVETALHVLLYERTAQTVIIVIDHNSDTEVTSTQAAVYRCIATGDSAAAPDLT